MIGNHTPRTLLPVRRMLLQATAYHVYYMPETWGRHDPCRVALTPRADASA